MGNLKIKQRHILVNYCDEITCEEILFMLIKLYLEDRGRKRN